MTTISRSGPLILLLLTLAGCSSYRMVIQGVDLDRLVESRRGPADPEGEKQEAVFHNDLGVFLEQDGDLDGALEQYRIARTRDPGLVLAYINAGNVRVKLNDLGKARQLYRESLKLEPENPQALNNLAWVLLMENRDPAEAIALLQRALAADPEHRYLYLDSLGWAQYQGGQTSAARETLRKAIEQTPEEENYLLAESHYHLGMILKEAGEKEQAILHIQESLRLHPDPEWGPELKEMTGDEN